MVDACLKIKHVMNEVKKVILGKDAVIELVMTAIIAKGHILVEDIPGVGKTSLALAFSSVMKLEQNRMQFTPDVLPTDVVGFSIWNKETNEFEYKRGAVFCNLFLADEINRTSSKTQSALLEVMEEGKVTVDGVTRKLPEPFIVIATQNPIGSAGTQLLPESQLDRFMIKLTMGYPDVANEINMLKGKQSNHSIEQLQQIINSQELVEIQKITEQLYIHDVVYQYIAELVAKTRNHPMITLGVSPRGSIALASMARAAAMMKGREFVLPEDVRMVFHRVAGHRMVLSPKARVGKVSVDEIIGEILREVAYPKLGQVKN